MRSGPVRILEISGTIAGAYCGWLLAAMGAEVHRVAGAAQVADPHIARALRYLNAGKTERIPGDVAGRANALMNGVDIVITDDRWALESLFELGVDDFAGAHPGLVVGISSVFGLTGPRADAPACELDAQAASAVAWVLGAPGRTPLSIPPEILATQAGAHLAAATLAALSVPLAGDRARVVDLSLADVLVSYVGVNCRFYIHHGMAWHRSGRRASDSGGAYPFVILPCKDGQVCLSGRTKGEWLRLVEALGSPVWASEPRYQSLRKMGREYPQEVDALLMPIFAQMTKAEIADMANRYRLTISPVRTIAEVLATEQFELRGFWRSFEEGGQALRAPGVPFRALAKRSPRSPSLNDQLLAQRPDRQAAGKAFDARRPFAGLRVVDLGWVWSAPQVSGVLAQFGADVIKVEHGARIDSMRLSGPVIKDGVVLDGDPLDMSPMFHQINRGKRGITLNLKEPRAIELLRRLIAESDIVIENMSPESLERAGLGYEALKELNPRLVMLSMSGAGQFGPLAQMRTYAPVMSSFVGLEALIGYAGEEPIGALNFALGDPNAAAHGLVALFGALIRSRATGQGAYIDLSQTEALLAALSPFILRAQVEQTQPAPRSNAHCAHAPYGIFPTAGDDCWISLAARSDTEWLALASCIATSGGTIPSGLATEAERLARVAELEVLVATWTRRYEGAELVARLHAAGVPAARVIDIDDLWSDPHFNARGMFSDIALPGVGDVRLVRPPWLISDFAAPHDKRGPRLGEHNDQVFSERLALAPAEVEALQASGVIS